MLTQKHVHTYGTIFTFKAVDEIECNHKSDIIYLKRPIFLYSCATWSELPSKCHGVKGLFFHILSTDYTMEIGQDFLGMLYHDFL